MKSHWLYGVVCKLGKVTSCVYLLSGPLVAQETTEQITIAALGDSLTQGYGLLQGEGLVPQLSGWLTANGHPVTVINAGVSGDTTAGGLARADWTLTPDIDGMILALGGNDMLRGIDPAVSRANLDGILQVAQQKQVAVMLVPMRAPGNFGPVYKQNFDRMYGELAAKYGVVLAAGFFDGLPENTPANIREFMQADGIHPNAKGVALIVDSLGPTVLEFVQNIDNAD